MATDGTRAGQVGIVGRPNVGKSTLLNAIIGERIAITSHQPQTTRDAILGVLTKGNTQMCFVDTPGIHRARTKLGARMNAQASSVATGCEVVLFLTDVPECRGGQFGEADMDILRSLPSDVPIVLGLNKIDVLKAKNELFPMLEALGKAYEFAEIVPLSAKKRDNTGSLVETLLRYMPDGEFAYNPEDLSDRPVRFFVAEFVREQILRRTRQEVPHGVAVVVERYEETPRIVRIHLVIHVDKNSHKPIVIGRGGEMLRTIGQEARVRVERLLGRQVHLETLVRVTPGWFERDDLLAEFGYAAGAREANRSRAPLAAPKGEPGASIAKPKRDAEAPVRAEAPAPAKTARNPKSAASTSPTVSGAGTTSRARSKKALP